MPVILAVRRLRQENQEFQTGLKKTFLQRGGGGGCRREERKREGERMTINPTLGINNTCSGSQAVVKVVGQDFTSGLPDLVDYGLAYRPKYSLERFESQQSLTL